MKNCNNSRYQIIRRLSTKSYILNSYYTRAYKIILSVFLCFFCFISCEKEDQDEKNNEEKPEILVSCDTLRFHNSKADYIYLYTKPAIYFTYEILERPDWLEISPESGIVNATIEKIKIRPKLYYLKKGFYREEILIESELGLRKLEIELLYGDSLSYDLPDSLYFDAAHDKLDLLIENEGCFNINYALSCPLDYVQFAETEGSIPPDSAKTISITVDKTTLETGFYSSDIYLKLNNIQDTVPIKIEQLIERKHHFHTEIIDAEYCKASGEIVFISRAGLNLVTYNPQTQESKELQLNYGSKCLSVSPDGTRAGVGHDGYFAYYDLQTMTQLGSFQTEITSVHDIILASNNWVYLFPLNSNSKTISCYNMEEEEPEEHINTGSQFRSITTARLHPSGKFLYGVSNIYITNEISKFDIQNGIADKLYTINNSYNWSVAQNFWYSESGDRIYVQYRNTFKAGENEENDIIYNGRINPKGYEYSVRPYITGLSHSSQENQLFIIMSGKESSDFNEPFLYFYDPANLAFEYKLPLERYIISPPGKEKKSCNAEPHYVFNNTDGTKVYILTKAAAESNNESWAVQTFDIN